MKKSTLILAFLMGYFILTAQQKPSIIPIPQNYRAQNATFHLNSDVSIYFDNPLLADEAHFLQAKIFEDKALTLPMGKGLKESGISLVLTGDDTRKGAYTLNMSNNSIRIESGTEEGIFNGIISLLQLIEFSSSEAIPCWNIEDFPKHDWRGVMLDESRHF
ncbi:MAG: hypothetical protein GX371_00655, partial [Bacteroidales bacterium]|nr:hypothetical protein [Bacteroidales bacterium]